MSLLQSHLDRQALAVKSEADKKKLLSDEVAKLVADIHEAVKPYTDELLSAKFIGDYGRPYDLSAWSKKSFLTSKGLRLDSPNTILKSTLALEIEDAKGGTPGNFRLETHVHAYREGPRLIAEFHPHTDPLKMVGAFLGEAVKMIHRDSLPTA